MGKDILFAFWFLLPAAAANVAPILTAKLPLVGRWQTPIDGGRQFRGTDLLGPHKTWRGLASGVVVSTVVFWLQQLAAAHTGWAAQLTSEIDYASLPTLLLGAALGLGALGGDAIESFFKRRRHIESGHAWVPFDQLDYILGAILASLPFVVLRPSVYIWMLVVWGVMHLLASYAGYKIGLKERPI